jgi:hypothetical protein
MPRIDRLPREAVELVSRNLVEVHDVEGESRKAIFDDTLDPVFQMAWAVHDEKVDV